MRTGWGRALVCLVVLAGLWPAAGQAQTVAPAEPEGGPRTLEVTPHNNLVHGQSVLLRGRGWPPNQSGQGAAQCVTGTTDTRGCGPVTFFPVDAAGNFRTHFRVSVILETSIGTFDCRVDECVIGSNYTPDATGARFVPLTFDPAGPDPVRRTVDVDPDTGLVDGQTVTVTGDDFDVVEPGYGGYAELAQCQVPVHGYADCDQSTFDYSQTDVAGHLDQDVRVEAVLHLPDGSVVDCRVAPCALSVKDVDEGFAAGAEAPLAFDPVGPLLPAATVDVDPDTGIVDAQRLRVTGSDWRPDADVIVLFCRAGATDQEDCAYDDFGYVQTDDDGDWSMTTYASATLFLNDGAVVDCRVEACSLVAARDEALTRRVETPLSFDPTSPLLRPTLTLARSTGLDDGDVIGVGGQGARPRSELLLRQCLASATDHTACDNGTSDWLYIGESGNVILESARADGAGVHWHGSYEVHRILHLADGRTVDCALSPCALMVSVSVEDRADFARADRAALDFRRGPIDPTSAGPVAASPAFTG